MNLMNSSLQSIHLHRLDGLKDSQLDTLACIHLVALVKEVTFQVGEKNLVKLELIGKPIIE